MSFTERDYAKYMARGSAVIFTALAVTVIASFGLRVLLARTLSTADYGLFFSIFMFVSFLGTFRHLGIDKAIPKFLSEFKARKKLDEIKSSISTALAIYAALTLTVFLILIALSEWLAVSFFGDPAARPIFIILSAWFSVIVSERFLMGIFQGFQDMVGRSGVELSRVAFTLGLVAIVVFFIGPDLTGIALAYLFGPIFAATLFFTLLRRRHSGLLRGKGQISKSLAKKLLVFGLPLILVGVSGAVMGHIDTLMITAFRPIRDVGFYQIAHPTALFLGYFGTALSVPLLPMVSELWARGKKETLRSALYFLAKFPLIFIIPVALILLAFPEAVIRLLFGTKYLAAAAALQALSIGMVFRGGGAILRTTLIGAGYPVLTLKSIGAAAVFNFFANLLLVPPYGAGGAAIATGLSFFIALVLSFYYVRRIIRFPVPVSAILKTLAGGGLTLLMVWGLKSIVPLPPWPALFVVMTPSLLFYVVWICRMGVIEKEELDLFARVVPVPARLLKFLRKLIRE